MLAAWTRLQLQLLSLPLLLRYAGKVALLLQLQAAVVVCSLPAVLLTSLGIQGAVVVDISIPQGATSHSIAADANGSHWANL